MGPIKSSTGAGGQFQDTSWAQEKTTQPTVELEYLGLKLNSKDLTVSIPTDKKSRMINEMKNILTSKQWSTKAMEKIVGKLHFTHVCYPELFPRVAEFYTQLAPATRTGMEKFWPTNRLKKNLEVQ